MAPRSPWISPVNWYWSGHIATSGIQWRLRVLVRDWQWVCFMAPFPYAPMRCSGLSSGTGWSGLMRRRTFQRGLVLSMTSIDRGSRVGSHVRVIDWETRLPDNGARSLRNVKLENRERFSRSRMQCTGIRCRFFHFQQRIPVLAGFPPVIQFKKALPKVPSVAVPNFL